MKILMIAPTPFFADRGCHVRIYEEVVSLKKLGHKVKIVTYHIGATPKGLDVERIPPLLFWYNKFGAGPSWWKPVLDFLLLIKSGQVFLHNDYDVIHAHLHEGVLIGFFLRLLKRGKTPLIFDYQGSMTDEILTHKFVNQVSILHNLLIQVERLINRMSDLTICSSRVGKQNLVRDFDIPPDKAVFIPDGIGTNFNHQTRGVKKTKNLLKILNNKKVVVYLGLLNEYQGIDLLLKSIRLAVSKYPNVHFLIMGYPSVSFYRNKTKELGIESFVTFFGRISYLRSSDYLALGDLAVSPKISRSEANGKLYNYMAAGLPTIVFNSPINREILGNLGIYAKFGDYKDFAKKLVFCLRSPGKMKVTSEVLKNERALTCSWNVSARKINLVYEKLVKNPK
jgi:glycosyltransferase involved in cell wall biosynthesis